MILGPKHSASDVAAELVKGLRDGSITLDDVTVSTPIIVTKITRRSTWAYLSVAAILITAADILMRITRSGSAIRLDLARSIIVQASEALNDLTNQRKPNVETGVLLTRASALSLVSGSRKPMPVVTALVTSEAAAAAQRVLSEPVTHWFGGTFDNNGHSGAVFRVNTDFFIANARMISSVPGGPSQGIIVEGRHAIVAYNVTVEGIEQMVDGLIWIGSTFRGCTITFNGGDVMLANSRFIGCRFDDSMNALPALKRAIQDSNGSPITYSSTISSLT
jgi:hypothetical protein